MATSALPSSRARVALPSSRARVALLAAFALLATVLVPPTVAAEADRKSVV